jgi:hypothetical protein
MTGCTVTIAGIESNKGLITSASAVPRWQQQRVKRQQEKNMIKKERNKVYCLMLQQITTKVKSFFGESQRVVHANQ